MGLINKIVPMLKADDTFCIHVTRRNDNGISVRIEPRIRLPDAETADPELAKLQVALAMPLLLRFDASITDMDAEIGKALDGMSQARQSTLSALDAYQEAQAEARNAAALAAQTKSPQAKKAAAKAPAPAPLPSPTALASAGDASTTPSTPTATASDPAPAADANQINIFE
ncbi:hypothetical protein [Luteimonas sp. MHLX1A]|uniref:hypothetical protein n=1 Tax=Alterluteimonas muca TaxID=2878684 RepID=UPI001E393271|nr:hypothetical protein [Luteimonas sp. MHLX1A]MCD9046758.1 hypothetical protein [Luteimonas sp. MHLX1A]